MSFFNGNVIRPVTAAYAATQAYWDRREMQAKVERERKKRDGTYTCPQCKGSGNRYEADGTRAACDWCGGSGRRRRCNYSECHEFGCGGYGYCYVPPEQSSLENENKHE